ncbi:MAG: 3'-5' exoribonuclease [Syntrophaceae bacterium]|nr:3'-5' exoribonuclease [Syntrophaceae bacterium]
MNSNTSDRIAVIDVETTGLSPWRNDRIIEIAIIMISSEGEVVSEYETLINPNRDIGPSRIHQIHSSDILNAPVFHDVAGDVIEILSSASIIAGHNISFDRNFIVKEYERIGFHFPEIPLLCTYRLLGRNSLAGCCTEFGLEFDGMAHRALVDARLTAKLVTFICADNIDILNQYRIESVEWPKLPAKQTPCFSRECSQQSLKQPPRFLQRLAHKIHHDIDADEANLHSYLALIDRVLEDRIIDKDDEDTLIDAALELKLTQDQIDNAHKRYIHSLAVLSLEDGIISNAERRDLYNVACLLGQDESTVDDILEASLSHLANAKTNMVKKDFSDELSGKKVCFTGELQASINGKIITREVAEAIAKQAGLNVANTVTKNLDLLVVADPTTQSGKAMKARKYGIRILADSVFWRMIGASID